MLKQSEDKIKKITTYLYRTGNNLCDILEKLNAIYLFIILFVLTALSFYVITEKLIFVAILMGYRFFHECVHFVACKYYRVKTHFFYFIPFIGCLALFDYPYKRKKCFNIILAGLVADLVYIISLWAVQWFVNGYLTDTIKINKMIIMLAAFNIVNCLPFYPYDGGRIIAFIDGRIKVSF